MDYEKAWKELRSTVIDEIDYWITNNNFERHIEAIVILDVIDDLEGRYDL